MYHLARHPKKWLVQVHSANIALQQYEANSQVFGYTIIHLAVDKINGEMELRLKSIMKSIKKQTVVYSWKPQKCETCETSGSDNQPAPIQRHLHRYGGRKDKKCITGSMNFRVSHTRVILHGRPHAFLCGAGGDRKPLGKLDRYLITAITMFFRDRMSLC